MDAKKAGDRIRTGDVQLGKPVDSNGRSAKQTISPDLQLFLWRSSKLSNVTDNFPHIGANVEVIECPMCDGSGDCPQCQGYNGDQECDLCQEERDCPACGGQGFVSREP